jgi:hypothetical protein
LTDKNREGSSQWWELEAVEWGGKKGKYKSRVRKMVIFRQGEIYEERKGEPKRPSRMGKNKENNRIKQILRTNERRRKCVEIVGKKMDENSTMNV